MRVVMMRHEPDGPVEHIIDKVTTLRATIEENEKYLLTSRLVPLGGEKEDVKVAIITAFTD